MLIRSWVFSWLIENIVSLLKYLRVQDNQFSVGEVL